MTARLASGIRVAALLRRVAAAGGFATVLARGDATAGSIAIVTRDRGETQVLEPVLALAGGYEWRTAASGESVDSWVERARKRDPDLWVIELDIPDAARFVAETASSD
ncbi:DUF1491 family protein [Polymorphobacter fuscus]|uniref:DUF1491 family protein n=1 Tax=Sandarakinorhabdus fusca TaxID=1439888 RepID=A0A7C9GUH1_9SPHN|nr:DUF1491 family protein [Polymorphobacter fuscus]KAB7647654.1 DUF1491 family protein [Polymorphobacter fuscus]MQT16938.1 DUF1491 family protein [Polymorphobacter fuscus]NJC09072.1 hypothetical protein [Polymorphobacter fuscus]